MQIGFHLNENQYVSLIKYMEIETDSFKNSWNLWYHSKKDNWTISGYEKIYTINKISDYWKLYNNWDKLGGVNNKHFFYYEK